MIIRTLSAEAFACYEKSCAPPPAGRGGSSGGGGKGKKPPAGYRSWGEYRAMKGETRNAEVRTASKYKRKSSPYGDFEP